MAQTPPPTSIPTIIPTLTYYGHCAFLWQTGPGLRVLIDPYRNRADRYWFTRRFPNIQCDLTLVTHAHFDHDAVDWLPETTSLIRLPGEFQFPDLSVKGILDYHSGARSQLINMPNVMFRLETNGVSFLHLGDNRVQWPEAVIRAVGTVDVLLVTVDDSRHLLTYPEVDELVARLNPRVVIPMHYYIPGLTAPSSGLEPPEGWLDTQPSVQRLGRSQIPIDPGSLPDSTQVWVLEPDPASLTAPATLP